MHPVAPFRVSDLEEIIAPLDPSQDGARAAMLADITDFRLRPHRLKATFKLSQNKSPEVRGRVAAASGDHPIARAMGQGASD